MAEKIYLLLLLGSIAVPLLRSFEPRVAFYKRLPALLLATTPVAAFFLAWDVWFTASGVWSFRPEHLLDVWLFGLPLEEWLFFWVIPYCCFFVYEVLNHFIKRDLVPSPLWVSTVLAVVLAAAAALNWGRLYPSVTFSLTAVLLLAQWLIPAARGYLSKFYLGYLVSLVPFFVVNGVLTSIPVVVYNPAENLGIRLGTVPLEDSIYLLLMLLMITNGYEWLKARASKKSIP